MNAYWLSTETMVALVTAPSEAAARGLAMTAFDSSEWGDIRACQSILMTTDISDFLRVAFWSVRSF